MSLLLLYSEILCLYDIFFVFSFFYVQKVNKSVILLSTKHHGEEYDNETDKPEIIMDYNSSKGGVDTFRFLINHYSCRHRTVRWTQNIFIFMLDAAAQNAISLKL